MPRLQRSDNVAGLISQPFRAGLTFSGRPSGPRIRGDCRRHFSLKLSQAIQLLRMTQCRTYGARILFGIDFPALPPDFLWNLVALANFMRLSLRKGAHVVVSSAAWQEIRVRSG